MKYNLLCCAVGVLFGLFLGLVYGAAVLCNNPLPVFVPAPKELKKEVTQFETSYEKSFDTLKKESGKLQAELISTKSELQKAKQRSVVLQGQVYSLLDSRFEMQQADTPMTTTPCDTLSVMVKDLMQASAQKDTLYEDVTAKLEQQTANKDTTIALKDAQYTDLKTAFEKSIQGQQLLADQNKQLSKTVRKQKIKSKVLSALLVVLTAVATNHLLQHHY